MFGAIKKIKDRVVDLLEAQINKPRDGWGNPAQAHGSPLVKPLYLQDEEEPVEAPFTQRPYVETMPTNTPDPQTQAVQKYYDEAAAHILKQAELGVFDHVHTGTGKRLRAAGPYDCYIKPVRLRSDVGCVDWHWVPCDNTTCLFYRKRGQGIPVFEINKT